jgi:hypothetical protein
MDRALFYRLSGALVASEIPLPTGPVSSGLLDAHQPGPQTAEARPITLRLAPALSGDPLPPEAWEHRDHCSVGKAPDGFILRLADWADFWIARDGAAVVCAPIDACPTETLAQIFLDQVLPMVLHACGRFAFHASSVAIGGSDLVAFLGHSGAGKSTVASSLVRAGTEVLFSDDCLAVEAGGADILAYPSYASTRLWPESAEALLADRDALPLASPRTAKLRAAFPVAPEPTPLRRLYLLAVTEGAPAITHLSRRDALLALAAHLYRLDTSDRTRLAGELDLLEKLVSRVRVARLAYRRSYADLPAVRAAILADLTPPG